MDKVDVDEDGEFAYEFEDIYSLDESSKDENGARRLKNKKRQVWP